MAAARDIVARCGDLGFALAGVTPARVSDFADAVRAWVATGRHGTMDWFAETAEARVDPRSVLERVRSVIVVADRYAARGEDEGSGPGWRETGRVARYARGNDYHREMKRRLHELCDALRPLHPGHEFRTVVDTAPFLEREHALRAGLGWIGKNTMLIHPRLGSYLLLGAVLTSLELEAPPEQDRGATDHCGTCTRCIDACPTSAITTGDGAGDGGRRSVDASRCVSYLTIERRRRIDPVLHRGMGDWVYGCDVCQEVCPHNSARGGGGARGDDGPVSAAYAPVTPSLDLLRVLGWTEADRRAAFASSAMKRVTLSMIRRNAVIALGNVVQGAVGARRAEMVAALEGAAGDADELVAGTARDVLAGLGA